MSMDVVKNSRSIYTILDVLGDVGGLFDMLRLILENLMSLLTLLIGSGLDRFLL